MAYSNFIPTVWASAIQRDLAKSFVYAADCNREYEGDVKKAGDSVRILGIARPTITTSATKVMALSNPEDVADEATTLNISHTAYFNYKVDDIDKRQSAGNVMEALQKETTEGLSDAMDSFISGLSAGAVKDAASSYQITAANVLEKIDAALVKLYENNVSQNAKITLTIPPWVYVLLKSAYSSLSTDNVAMLENGMVGKYGNVIIRMSNNISNDGTNFLLQLKTTRAIAFVNPMTHIEAYRPESSFSDAVKGFVLYDGKIVRPKEIICMHVKK